MNLGLDSSLNNNYSLIPMKKITVPLLTVFAFFFILILAPKNTSACQSRPSTSTNELRKKILSEINQRLPSITPIINLISPTPQPTNILQPTATPQPTTIPQPTTPPSNTNIRDYLIAAINDYRRSKGLSTITPDQYTCDFAKVRAQEISTNFSHDAFLSRANNHTLPYPSYQLVTENIATTNDYKNVVPMWINSPGHAANMEKDTPYVCVESFGNYYAYEGWKP